MDYGHGYKYHIDYEQVESMWAANNSATGYSDNALIAEQTWKFQTAEVSIHCQQIGRMAEDLTHHVEFMQRNSRNAKGSDDPLAVQKDNIKSLEKIMGPLFQGLEMTESGQISMLINPDSLTHVLKVLQFVCSSTTSGFEFAEGMLSCAERMCKTLENVRLEHECDEIEQDIFLAYENDEEILCKIPISELLRDPGYNHVGLSKEIASRVIDTNDYRSVVDLLQQAMIVIVEAGNCLQAHVRPMIDLAEALYERKVAINKQRSNAIIKQQSELTEAPGKVVRLRAIPDIMKKD